MKTHSIQVTGSESDPSRRAEKTAGLNSGPKQYSAQTDHRSPDSTREDFSNQRHRLSLRSLELLQAAIHEISHVPLAGFKLFKPCADETIDFPLAGFKLFEPGVHQTVRFIPGSLELFKPCANETIDFPLVGFQPFEPGEKGLHIAVAASESVEVSGDEPLYSRLPCFQCAQRAHSSGYFDGICGLNVLRG